MCEERKTMSNLINNRVGNKETDILVEMEVLRFLFSYEEDDIEKEKKNSVYSTLLTNVLVFLYFY